MQFHLKRNAAWSVIEALSSAVILFFLYKIIVANLGIEALGVWSLVLATTSLMRLADAGAASGLARFVAVHFAASPIAARKYIDTAILTNLGLYCVLALLFYLPAKYGLRLAIRNDTALQQACELLPYALASFVLTNVAAAASATLIGLHRADLKSQVIIGGIIVQAAASVLLISTFGLVAMAQAQILQNLFCIFVSLALAKYVIDRKVGILLPVKWKNSAFKEIVGFGAQLQLSAIIIFLYDPITKFLMGTFGGLELTGIFELANRLVFQTRALLVTPTQALVPAYAAAKLSSHEKLETLYSRSIAHIVAAGLPTMGALLVASPTISFILLGSVNWLFITLVMVLVSGWLTNLLAAPAYLMGVGTGLLKWNIAGNLLTTSTCLVLGFTLGEAFGGYGVAVAAAIAQASGSLLIAAKNCRAQSVRTTPKIDEVLQVVRSIPYSLSQPLRKRFLLWRN
ncbi:oligosaccharide flippase family protein [Bradyrhizobium sp. 30]|uniref:oligosaccharide flippase family protein n=1 Tax=Bradyrhizobium sp. 30 TaxID=2782669 RepID=UPI001FFAB513|nr:oligosaccharide flippase family protein [Bradyrhizobium sp. 30]MCK1294843.1 oligosaccharide flippase family protein [Bradyrhizobium sp. 30]